MEIHSAGVCGARLLARPATAVLSTIVTRKKASTA
jgi:hypothetical protein